MRLANRRPGTSVTFADAASGENILQMASDENGLPLMAFRIYDASGYLVNDSEGLHQYPEGLMVRCANGDLLLDVPGDSREDVRYRLYNRDGALLTQSDGARTKIGPLLRMEGVGHHWTPPAPVVAAGPIK